MADLCLELRVELGLVGIWVEWRFGLSWLS